MKQKLLFKDKDIFNWSSDFTPGPKATKNQKSKPYSGFHPYKLIIYKKIYFTFFNRNQFCKIISFCKK